MSIIVDDLIDKLDATREQLLVAIAELPDEALLQPNAIGKFSVGDVLVNITAWEAELVTGMMRLDQGKKPDKLLEAVANRQAYNQKRYQENKDRDLDLIFDDLQQVRVQLESWLEQFSERALTDKKRYKWFKGRSLLQMIEDVTFKNEGRYVPLMTAFATQWQEK